MSKLIDIASAEIGVKEIEGAEHNERIITYAKEAGFDWYNADETPWCSIFLNWVAFKAGLPRSKDGRSGSWVGVGEAVTEPHPGDVILCGTGGNINKIYHVGLFMGFSDDGKRVFCLGGNQTNQVSISKMWRTEVAGYRRIETGAEPEDHIASLCEMMHGLLTGALGGEGGRAEVRAFFDKHLAPWAGKMFADLEGAESAVLYMPVGTIGRLFIDVEREAFEMAA